MAPCRLFLIILPIVGLLCLSQNSQMAKSYVATPQALHDDIHDAGNTVLQVANAAGFSVNLGGRRIGSAPPSPRRANPVRMVAPAPPEKPRVRLLQRPPPPCKSSASSIP